MKEIFKKIVLFNKGNYLGMRRLIKKIIEYCKETLSESKFKKKERVLKNSSKDQKILEELQEIEFFESIGFPLKQKEIEFILSSTLKQKIDSFYIRLLEKEKQKFIEIYNSLNKRIAIFDFQTAFRNNKENHFIEFQHKIEGKDLSFVLTFGKENELYLSIVENSKFPLKVNLYLEKNKEKILLETIENLLNKSMFDTPLQKKGSYLLEFISIKKAKEKFYIEIYLDTK